jgi:redox-sensitive bicupin YhaK (pirin superfamily)
VTITEIALDANASVDQDMPASYNGFAYVIRGSIRIGAEVTPLEAGQVGWLDRPEGDGTSALRVIAGAGGARLVFYAGQPQGDRIVSHGPFIGDSRDDIVRLYAEYRAGRFERMSDLARRARVDEEVRRAQDVLAAGIAKMT